MSQRYPLPPILAEIEAGKRLRETIRARFPKTNSEELTQYMLKRAFEARRRELQCLVTMLPEVNAQLRGGTR